MDLTETLSYPKSKFQRALALDCSFIIFIQQSHLEFQAHGSGVDLAVYYESVD